MLEIPNTRVVIPTVVEMNLEVPINGGIHGYPAVTGREALLFTYVMPLTSQLVLPWTPDVPYNLEIYKDGVRVINGSTDFGETHLAYEVNDDVVTFNQPVVGEVKAVFDTVIAPLVYPEYIIEVDNFQGGEITAPLPDETYASLVCEPVVCTQPYNGFARLSDDRKSIVYVPEVGYAGEDMFSYTVITQRGQIAEPQCIYINVTDDIDPSLRLNGTIVLFNGVGVEMI